MTVAQASWKVCHTRIALCVGVGTIEKYKSAVLLASSYFLSGLAVRLFCC